MAYRDPGDPLAKASKDRYYAALKADPERWAKYLRERADYARRLQRDQPETYREQIRLRNLKQRAKTRGIHDADIDAYAASRARHNALERARYRENPVWRQSRKENNLRRMRASQLRLNSIKVERGCVDCGYRVAPEALHFDHIDPAEKITEISQLKTATPAKLLAEINKCVVRCANCHAIRTAQQVRERWAAKKASAA